MPPTSFPAHRLPPRRRHDDRHHLGDRRGPCDELDPRAALRPTENSHRLLRSDGELLEEMWYRRLREEPAMRLTYAIKYVADMERAIAFHRDVLGLPLKFESPFWSEFDTGGTTLALHPITGDHKPGEVQLGFAV